jgi:hypothetical protein
MEDKDFGIVFWVHLVLIIIAYCSPFLFSWELISFGIIILWVEYIVFTGCPLTHAQIGKKDKEITFYTIYLEKMGFKFNREKIKNFFRNIVPLIILAIAIIWQVLFGNQPLLF